MSSDEVAMQWSAALVSGRLVKRYKRFLAEVILDDGREVLAHCPNTGAMTGCDVPGSRVWLLPSTDPKRKTPFTWQVVDVAGQRICIHSALANKLVAERLARRDFPGLSHFQHWRGEWPLDEGSRIDFALGDSPESYTCFMEVKAVTLHLGNGLGAFPDAVSARARRHVEALTALRQQGFRVLLCFAVLHEGITEVTPADEVDPRYAKALRLAAENGVELVALAPVFSDQGVVLGGTLPVRL